MSQGDSSASKRVSKSGSEDELQAKVVTDGELVGSSDSVKTCRRKTIRVAGQKRILATAGDWLKFESNSQPGKYFYSNKKTGEPRWTSLPRKSNLSQNYL